MVRSMECVLCGEMTAEPIEGHCENCVMAAESDEAAGITELIVITQLPEFEERFMQANAEIAKRLALSRDLDVSEESKAAAKKIKAEINKDFERFEERRKAVKRAINEPYEELDRLYQSYIANPYKDAIASLDGKIKAIEEGQLRQKHNDATLYFVEYRNSLGEDVAFLDFERLGISVSLSVTAKKLKEQIRDRCDKVKADIEGLRTMNGNAERYIAEYRQSLDVPQAIAAVNAAMEREQQVTRHLSNPDGSSARHTAAPAMPPEAEAEVTAAVEVAEPAEAAPAVPQEISEDKKIYTTEYKKKIRGTKGQLVEFKARVEKLYAEIGLEVSEA